MKRSDAIKWGIEAARARGVRIGRKRIMTPAVVRRAETLLRRGLSVKQAAAALGVSVRSVYGHVNKKLVRKWTRQE